MNELSGVFGLGIKGLFFNNKTGEANPPAPAPVMPFKDASEPGKIQAYVSDYLLDSLTDSIFKATNISESAKFVVNHNMVPPGHPLELNTTAFELLFPKIATVYARDRPVDVQLAIRGLRNIVAKEDSISLDADLGL